MNTLLILLQAVPTPEVNPAYQIWNLGIMDAILDWKNNSAMYYARDAVDVARYLCALFAVFWCAARLYPVIAGDERLSVLPILRPFVIGLVLSYWPAFIDVVQMPGREIEKYTKQMFDNSNYSMRTVSELRFKKYDEYAKVLMGMSAVAEKGKDAEKNSTFQAADIQKNVSFWSSNPLTYLAGAIAGMEMFIMSKVKWLMFQIMQYISLLFLNVVVCGVLFMQAAGLTVMAFIGPLAFAFSCVDAWKQSWAQWTARFFSISLWSGLAYFVCTVGTDIIKSGLEAEIAVIDAAFSNPEGPWGMAMAASLSQNDNGMFMCLCLFVALGMLIIFPVSTWVIQTSGGSAILKPVTTAVSIGTAALGAAFIGGGGGGAVAAGGSGAGGQAAIPKS